MKELFADGPELDLPKAPELSSDLDDIIKSYQNAPPVEPPPPGPNPAGGPGPLPFLSHDATQSPKQEFYKTGAKKGLPKPPKKGQAPPLNPAGQLSIQATIFITGAIFVTMIDMIIPLFLVGVYNFMQLRKATRHPVPGSGFKPMDYEKVQMSKKQKEDLGMVADAVVRELKLSGSPTFLFFLGLAGVYFMNFILQKSLAESEQRKQDEKNTSKMAVNYPNGQGPYMGGTQ